MGIGDDYELTIEASSLVHFAAVDLAAFNDWLAEQAEISKRLAQKKKTWIVTDYYEVTLKPVTWHRVRSGHAAASVKLDGAMAGDVVVDESREGSGQWAPRGPVALAVRVADINDVVASAGFDNEEVIGEKGEPPRGTRILLVP